jgi:hypothetical protein
MRDFFLADFLHVPGGMLWAFSRRVMLRSSLVRAQELREALAEYEASDGLVMF